MRGGTALTEPTNRESETTDRVWDSVQFGRHIKAARARRGMTAATLSSVLKRDWGLTVTPGQIGHYETGRSAIPARVWAAIVFTLQPKGGFYFFEDAFSSDGQRISKRLRTE